MGYFDDGFALGNFVESLQNFFLVFGVGECSRLVKNQNRRVSEHHPRDCNTLLFAAAEIRALVAENRFCAVGQTVDDVGTLRPPQNRQDFLVSCVGLCHSDIFQNACFQEFAVLKNK